MKVDLGFPDEMWDTPDAEIVRLKTQVHKSSDEVLGGGGEGEGEVVHVHLTH